MRIARHYAHSDGMNATPRTAPRPAITAVAAGDGSPETVTVTVDGVIHIVDVSVDRDDWQLPEVDDAIAHRVLWAIDDAVEAYLADADDACEPRRIERVWARAVAS